MDKLKELTDKLYNEGLEAGRSQAEKLVADAKAEAEKIIAEANAKAEQIVSAANAKAEESAKNSLTEISLAGRNAITKIKSEIENLVVAKAIAEPLNKALDAQTIVSVILEIAKNWNAGSGNLDLKVLLPTETEKELNAKFATSVKQILSTGIEISACEQVKNGFKIGAKNGGYYITFTDESFDALLRPFLREKVAKLLF